MFALETHPSRRKAERARNDYVRAQQIVDSVWKRITGEEVLPKAEDTYLVEARGESFAVLVDDPSLTESIE